MRRQPRNNVLFAHNDARLWSAQQLIAGEAHHIGPGRNALLRRWLVRQSVSLSVEQATTAEIVHHWQVMTMRHFNKLCNGGCLCKTRYKKIAGVDRQQQSCPLADRR